MKKIIAVLFLIMVISESAFCKSDEKFDVKSESFMDLGRYIETLEVNDDEENINIIRDDTFEEEAMLDVVKRYEQDVVELKLDDSNTALNVVNNDRLFKLKINETQYRIENSIKNENMIWDGTKSFSSLFLNNPKHLAPIPGVVNSSKVTADISPSLSASMGQTYLYDSLGPSVLFIRANESTYNTGSVISYKGDIINISAGSFASSYNWASSGGAVIASNSIKLPRNTGSFVLGGAFFSNEYQSEDKLTGGGFLEYTYKRLKLNAQVGQSKFSDSGDYDTSLYLIPELRISDSLSLKTRLIRNVSQNTMQDELALTYTPKKSKNNFEFEINASNQYTQNSNIKQRIKLSTSFKI